MLMIVQANEAAGAVRGAARDLVAPMTANTLRGLRFAWIDAARGVAALTVLIWHYQHFYFPEAGVNPIAAQRDVQPLYGMLAVFYEHGHLAVQFFWLISGFVFAHVYLGARRDARSFFVARLARLYPLHLATLLLVAALQALSMKMTGVHQIYPGNTAENFLLHLGLAAYWPAGAEESFNGPIWSVSVEVVSYAAFFVALPILFRLGAVGVALAAVAAGALSVIAMVAPLGVNKDIAVCATYFFGGAATFATFHQLKSRPALLAGVGALGVAGFAALWSTGDPVLRSLSVLGIGPALLLGLAMLDLGKATCHPSLVRLGDISYGVYLLQVPLQIAMLLAMRWLGLSVDLVSEPWFLGLYVALTLVLAALCRSAFEIPAERWLKDALSARRGAIPSRRLSAVRVGV